MPPPPTLKLAFTTFDMWFLPPLDFGIRHLPPLEPNREINTVVKFKYVIRPRSVGACSSHTCKHNGCRIGWQLSVLIVVSSMSC